MLKTLLILPDGTELFSGNAVENAIVSATLTQCVNSGEELTLGSTCANMLEAKIITPNGRLIIEAGAEITAYKIDDSNQRHKIGIFTTEKPTRPSANSVSITAYDRVNWLDKDLTQWLAGLEEWPYSLYKFAWMVCAECGLELQNTEIPNGDYQIEKFAAEGITGRKLMQWVGEIAGRFCRATPDGQIELAWYTPAQITIGANASAATEPVAVSYKEGNLSIEDPSAEIFYEDGALWITSASLKTVDGENGNVVLLLQEELQQQYYFQNGLTFEDYLVAPIEKVQIKQGEDDVGTIYPNLTEKTNTYVISGNYLLTASNAERLLPVAQVLYEHLKNISYTPCKISMPANLTINAGNTVQIVDKNGKRITAYVMTRTQSGQKDTLECTGTARRDSVSAVNSQSLEALSGKVFNLRTDVDGLKVENADTHGKMAQIQLDIEGISSTVSQQNKNIENTTSTLSRLEQTTQGISATIKSIQDNGVAKVENEFGLTIEESSVKIHRSNSEMTNKLDEKGMYVVRNEGSSNETMMLRADADGVIATDVKVRNFLQVGSFARFEDYRDGTDEMRTACFWVGG